MRVRVYFNLHKKLFSVMDKRTRRVVSHTEHIVLHNVKFIVNENGRQRVLREKKKNVHAFVEGDVLDMLVCERVNTNVTYNPYKYNSFMYLGENGLEPISQAHLCCMLVDNKKPQMQVS